MVVDVLAVLLGLVAVGSGVLVFVVDSMARATFLLLASFVAVGAELLLLDLHYLGAITVLMMGMEMAIMVVFMIMMMMNPGGLMPMSMVHNGRGAKLISVAVFLVLAAGALLVPWPERVGAVPADPALEIGRAIMGSKMLVMMTVSPVLFATIVAALTLGSARGRYDRLGDDLDARPARDHQPGGVGR